MLVERTRGTADASEGFAIKSRKYSVESPALVFDVLCNRMYNNPFETMVQEYLANARDAHREKGNEGIPVEVTLPNQLEPYLIIRDYGPGLTEQRIDDVFTKLGASTKSDDDVMTGGFGLGAKIGWAYNDSFTVISVVNGVRSVYLAYRDAAGIGRMDTLNVDTTDEPNGVAIRIEIQECHFTKLHDLISKITYFWTVSPINVNGTPFRHYDSVFRDLFYGDLFFASNGVFAIVDGIPYSINKNNVPILENLSLRSDRVLCLFFDVGELDIAINREGLNYSQKTIQTITHNVQNVLDSAASRVQQALQIHNIEDRITAVRECYTRLGAPKRVFIELMPMVYMRFSYKYPQGSLHIMNVDGCRNLLGFVHNNGKAREAVSYRTRTGNACASFDTMHKSIKAGEIERVSISFEDAYRQGKFNFSDYHVCMLNVSVADTVTQYMPKFRTLVVNKPHYQDQYVIFTSNWEVYKFLSANGAKSIYDLEDSVYKRNKASYGDRNCYFTELDVKSIKNRNVNTKLSLLDPKKDMWCTFKERNDALVLTDHIIYTVFPDFKSRKCWYVVAEQIPIIKDLGIPHYTDVYKEEQSRIVPNAYGAFMHYIQQYDDLDVAVSFVQSVVNSAFSRGSVFAALLDSVHLFAEDHVFVRYVKAVAKAKALDYDNHVTAAISAFRDYADSLRRISRKVPRSFTAFNNHRTKLNNIDDVLQSELYQEFPLLRYISDDFGTRYGTRFAEAEAAAKDHLLKYLLGKC